MKLKIKFFIIKLLSVFGVISFSACSINEKDSIGIKGYVKDEQGTPLTNVSISYRTFLISVKTNATGDFNINEPRTLFIEFKKEGYHPLLTKINNFSEDASYNFNTIILKKTSNPHAGYKDISLNTNPKLKKLNLFGTVLNSFKEPLKHVTVTLTDSFAESYSLTQFGDSNGYFDFRKLVTQIAIQKDGFRELVIDLPAYEKDSLKITLLENASKKGVYIIKSGTYIPLPQIKLSHKSKEKIGHILWGGNFAYDITDFFYPETIKEFKIEKDSIIRFIIFEPTFSHSLFKAQSEDGYLCTADYKLSLSPFPSAKNGSVSIHEIYPPKYSRNLFDEPIIIDFKPLNRNSNYVFVNSKK